MSSEYTTLLPYVIHMHPVATDPLPLDNIVDLTGELAHLYVLLYAGCPDIWERQVHHYAELRVGNCPVDADRGLVAPIWFHNTFIKHVTDLHNWQYWNKTLEIEGHPSIKEVRKFKSDILKIIKSYETEPWVTPETPVPVAFPEIAEFNQLFQHTLE